MGRLVLSGGIYRPYHAQGRDPGPRRLLLLLGLCLGLGLGLCWFPYSVSARAVPYFTSRGVVGFDVLFFPQFLDALELGLGVPQDFAVFPL